MFIIATATGPNPSTLASNVNHKIEIQLEKLANESIFKILENARTYLRNFLDSKGW